MHSRCMWGQLYQREAPHTSVYLTRSWTASSISRYWKISFCHSSVQHSLIGIIALCRTMIRSTLVHVGPFMWTKASIGGKHLPAVQTSTPLVWRELKHFIARQVKQLNKKELVKRITLFWSQRMMPEKCCTYVH